MFADQIAINVPRTKRLKRSSRVKAARSLSILDTDAFPVEELALLAAREGWRPRPIYQAHKWFARRFASAFRGILTAAFSSIDADFWQCYQNGVDLTGKTILDPFVGGGTSVVEAQKLGAYSIGNDIDAVACAVSRFEVRAAEMPDLTETLVGLQKAVGERLAPYYRTREADGSEREVLHYFWVQKVQCGGCERCIDAHPHHQLAHEAEGKRQWVFCPCCYEVQILPKNRRNISCEPCKINFPIAGPVVDGILTCPDCGRKEKLIDVAARTGTPPQWRLFAVETLVHERRTKAVPLSERCFRAANEYDQQMFRTAEQTLNRIENALIPDRAIPRDRADRRIVAYGYQKYRDLFNPRQLLHLASLAQAISALSGDQREAAAIAFSDHLTTNCMLTHYAFGWRRLCPLFSVRAFRHIVRPVEINPWLSGTGRGTYPNAIRQVQRAIDFAKHPTELLPNGGFTKPAKNRCSAPSASITNKDSRSLTFIPDASVDLVLSDPPYFDNIAYSELSDFYLPWLQQFGLAPKSEVIAKTPPTLGDNLAAKGRGVQAEALFWRALGECLQQVERVLKPEGRFVFTYQHQTARGWLSLARALATTQLIPMRVFPMLGNSLAGPHRCENSIAWDAVLVLSKGNTRRKMFKNRDLEVDEGRIKLAQAYSESWDSRLADLDTYRPPDSKNLRRACLTGASLGLFLNSDKGRPEVKSPLGDVLA